MSGGAGSHFLLAAGAQNMNQGPFCMCDGPLLSSQVSRPQNPPRRMALINSGAALLDRKDMGGPPHVYLNLFPPTPKIYNVLDQVTRVCQASPFKPNLHSGPLKYSVQTSVKPRLLWGDHISICCQELNLREGKM